MISKGDEIIRELKFDFGLNLIIDETTPSDSKSTGNNVGKTTILKLIDVCLGANPSIVYSDTENKKEVYDLVKEYLFSEKVLITLVLSDDLSDPKARTVTIQRNFLPIKGAIRTINGTSVSDSDFVFSLQQAIMPSKECEKPSFRQVISHNIRYRDESIENTLKTLNKYTSDIEYETLYLYLLGCNFTDGEKKQSLIISLNQENLFKARLEKGKNRTTYEIELSLIKDEIDELNKKKKSLNANDNLELDLTNLNEIRLHMNAVSAEITNLEIRKKLIEDSQQELNSSISKIDIQQLKILYSEVKAILPTVQKSFEELVDYHNKMIIEKAKYLGKELPIIKQMIESKHKELSLLMKEEKEASEIIASGESFEELERIITELNEKYRIKGEYEAIISQITESENNITKIQNELSTIDNSLYSVEFEKELKGKIIAFNKHFSTVSNELYGEKYALTYYKEKNKKQQEYYKFNSFNTNIGSGKKQGEILCFDLAYTLYADQQGIPCLHFLLNDKKELMHDNQLLKVAKYIKGKKLQLVISILKDKLPSQIFEEAYTSVVLSPEDKLFRIEKHDSRLN